MKTPVGIGFLSFAHGHVQLYADVMKQFEDARLIIGYDDLPERGQPVCENAGMCYTPHVEDVLNHPEVQAVIIGSETSRHEELAVAAAQAGKHILLQKPLAFSMQACDNIIAAVNKAGIHFAMAFQMRHDPANIRIREIVHSGMLGDIAVIRRRHCIGVLLVDSFVNGFTRWHVEADKNKGMFMDDAVHPADWFHWIFGKPVSVMAEIDNIITNIAPDDNGYAIYRFSKGEMGTIFNSSVVMAAEGATEIYGSKGVLIQNYGDGPACGVPRCPDGPALKVFRYGESDWDIQDVPIPPGGQGDRIRNVPRPWLDSLIAETTPPATAEDGRIATEMILGAYQSSETGKRVTFPLS